MEKKSDKSKAIAFVLILLTVLISATSTWVLVTKTMSSESGSGFNKALVQLHILKGHPYEQVQSDANSGDVKLYIAKSNGG